MSTKPNTDNKTIINKSSCLIIGMEIVDQENKNFSALEDKYSILAEDLSSLDEADLHSTMCQLQDKATPTGWNRFMAGTRKPLGKLGLVWTSTRNKDSRKSPKPFRLESKTLVQARKLAEESREEAENDRLLAEAAERNAARKQEQDQSITAKDLADSISAEASRLGISLADVRDCLTSAITASRKAEAASRKQAEAEAVSVSEAASRKPRARRSRKQAEAVSEAVSEAEAVSA